MTSAVKGTSRQTQSIPTEMANERDHLRQLARSINDINRRTTLRGAMLRKSADQTTANYTTAAAIAFNEEAYDFGAWHVTSGNTTRLTVPGDVSYVRVGGTVFIDSSTADTWKQLDIRLNGAADYDGFVSSIFESGMTSGATTILSGPIAVIAGDYFELFLTEESDTSITIRHEYTHFWIEAVG